MEIRSSVFFTHEKIYINAAGMVGIRNVYRIFVEELEEKKTFGRSRHRWKDSITVDIKEISYDAYWIHLAQDRVQWQAIGNTIINLFWFSKTRGLSSPVERVTGSREELSRFKIVT
jgi:hypothetical protein